MKKNEESAEKLTQWGDSLLNKLPGKSRKRRKRDASKRRRLSGKSRVERGLQDDEKS